MDKMEERICDRRYLLDIGEFLAADAGGCGKKAESGGVLLEKAFGRVDPERRGKARRMRQGRPQAACLGAGLLLQLAVREALEGRAETDDGAVRRVLEPAAGGGAVQRGLEPAAGGAVRCVAEAASEDGGAGLAGGLIRCTVSGLLECIPEPLPLTYRYGGNGKPYFREYPFYFNLSHSGDYVLCALSGREIGADIQEHRKCDSRRLAERFFSGREMEALENYEREHPEGKDALFFRLWARKEAYGKLSGGGIAGAVGVSLLPGEEKLPRGGGLSWEECDRICGYSIAVCSISE